MDLQPILNKYVFVKKYDVVKGKQKYAEILGHDEKDQKFLSGQIFDYRITICNKNVDCGFVDLLKNLTTLPDKSPEALDKSLAKFVAPQNETITRSNTFPVEMKLGLSIFRVLRDSFLL